VSAVRLERRRQFPLQATVVVERGLDGLERVLLTGQRRGGNRHIRVELG